MVWNHNKKPLKCLDHSSIWFKQQFALWARKAIIRWDVSQASPLWWGYHTTFQIQHTKGALLSSLMSSLHWAVGLLPPPSTFERLAFLQNSTGFLQHLSAWQRAHPKETMNIWRPSKYCRDLSFLSSPFLLLSLLSSAKESGTATWHFSLTVVLINYKPTYSCDFFFNEFWFTPCIVIVLGTWKQSWPGRQLWAEAFV